MGTARPTAHGIITVKEYWGPLDKGLQQIEIDQLFSFALNCILTRVSPNVISNINLEAG